MLDAIHDLLIYDNGGETFDRYTIVFPSVPENPPGSFYALAASTYPSSPGGFGQHCSAAPGPHLGQQIAFDQLPEQVQKFVNNQYQ